MLKKKKKKQLEKFCPEASNPSKNYFQILDKAFTKLIPLTNSLGHKVKGHTDAARRPHRQKDGRGQAPIAGPDFWFLRHPY